MNDKRDKKVTAELAGKMLRFSRVAEMKRVRVKLAGPVRHPILDYAADE